jgi:translation initiation factor IF-2
MHKALMKIDGRLFFDRIEIMTVRKSVDDEKEERISEEESREILALVLKADTTGTEEAIISSLQALDTDIVIVEVIHAGIGNISKTDLLMAETGSKLIIGFNVDLLPRIKEAASEKGIEIRLHDIIYRLRDDIEQIIRSTVPPKENEKITGRARVIALFPGGRKGIILGCEVLDGALVLGRQFRLISDPGIVYVGTIDSLHIETKAVKKAVAGQQVGLEIPRFKRAKKNDLVEVFETIPSALHRWRPQGRVIDLRSGRR